MEGSWPEFVVLDHLMPQMNVRDFLAHLHRVWIGVPSTLFTAMNVARLHVPTRAVRAMIGKPFDLKRLFDQLSKVEPR
jgi:DNA-binding NtrC family response regulator